MRVLIGCELSGKTRESMRDLGYDAWSCDIEPSDDNSPYHIRCDVRDIVGDGWDLGVFHPPCTRLCNSGVRWLHERDLWGELDEACDLFNACLNAPIPHVAVENPIAHKYAIERIGRKHDQTVQPYEFGHAESKRTCFWLRNLPPLLPTCIVRGEIKQSVHRMPPGKDRAKKRSETFQGIADAMARQWGGYVSRFGTRAGNTPQLHNRPLITPGL